MPFNPFLNFLVVTFLEILSEDLFQDVAFEKVSVYPCLSFQKKKKKAKHAFN